MTLRPGADRSTLPAGPSLSSVVGEFGTALSAYLRAFAGLFGLELRETGSHALVLATLAVGFLVTITLAYLFLLVILAVVLAGWMGGGWIAATAILFVFHLALAAALLWMLFKLGRRPLFPGTREAVNREIRRIS